MSLVVRHSLCSCETRICPCEYKKSVFGNDLHLDKNRQIDIFWLTVTKPKGIWDDDIHNPHCIPKSELSTFRHWSIISTDWEKLSAVHTTKFSFNKFNLLLCTKKIDKFSLTSCLFQKLAQPAFEQGSLSKKDCQGQLGRAYGALGASRSYYCTVECTKF